MPRPMSPMMPPVMIGGGGGGSSGSMSDNSETSFDDKLLLDGEEQKCDDICRDYLRNVCKRGKRCKYRHPDQGEAKQLGREQEYTFCHDFQNSGCRRPNCKFMHCTREEEEHYKQTGQLPVRLQQAAALGIGVLPKELPLLKGEVPVCKDFLKGECKRSGRCKYRHVTQPQFDLEQARKNGRLPLISSTDTFDSYSTDDYDQYDAYDAVIKRRRTDDTYPYDMLPSPMPPLGTTTDLRLLEDDNIMLRRKVDELKKQVSDLAATNEVLLEQNARYRSKGNNVMSSLPTVVTVSQMLTPTMTSTPLTTRPTMLPPIPGSLQTPINTIALNATSELIVSRAIMQARIAGDLGLPNLASITAPPLNTPVSVSLNHAQGAIVPVTMTLDNSLLSTQRSMASGSMAVSMSQTSMSTVPLLGSSQNASLVSYPIMSHAQIANSSLVQ